MDGGALFRVRTEANTRVLTVMSEIGLHKNEVGGYAYNDVNTLLKQIERVLERQLFEDSADGMKGLASDVSNALNDYKSTLHIKKRDVLTASRAVAKRASTEHSTVKPKIDYKSNAQDKPIGRTSSVLRQTASRRGSRRVSPRYLGGTSRTPSSEQKTTEILSRCISTRSTNFSPPSQR